MLFFLLFVHGYFLLLILMAVVYYLKLKHARDERLKVENCLKCNGDQRRCTECPGPKTI